MLDNASRYAADAPVTVRARAAPHQVLLRIGDRGPGIAREDLERVFEAFHSPGDGSGTGLGLGGEVRIPAGASAWAKVAQDVGFASPDEDIAAPAQPIAAAVTNEPQPGGKE